MARLQVIALVSGGKDSFYGLLHCMRLGHDVVALANLYPAAADADAADAADADDDDAAVAAAAAAAATAGGEGDGHVQVQVDGGDDDDGDDLNSFMYQTVGHAVVPLYAAATGIPLYRQPIRGRAACHERDYGGPGDDGGDDDDETEAMVPLLAAIKGRHPGANALCSGAILSTYQRTRVESVALRLGLEPLAFLWQYPVLPPADDDVQLLRDMAAAGLEARIVKVASAGLDDSHLWEPVTAPARAMAVARAVGRFGGLAHGAALGEGGEFETMVVDGPPDLFKMRIVVPDDGRTVVAAGGGASWLSLRRARLEEKPKEPRHREWPVRTPPLLDAAFEAVLRALDGAGPVPDEPASAPRPLLPGASGRPLEGRRGFLQWFFEADAGFTGSIAAETAHVVDKIRTALCSAGRDAVDITSTMIVLADMADFAHVNGEYKKLFTRPNPPSRVTISCGRLLPAGRRIAVHMALPDPALAQGERGGLHVQSRSFWAPANIGPYSQAVDVPVETALRAVYVAGQIPLVPATMSLPPAGARTLHEQVVLSLQHLWRIGAAVQVQCWTSAVAYFGRAPSVEAMAARARLASQAWSLAHARAGEAVADESDGDADVWDVRYNHEYTRPWRRGTTAALPDASVFQKGDQEGDGGEARVPPVFAVEVEGLPRGAEVEWHAHTGLANMAAGCAEAVSLATGCWRGWHTAVRSADGLVLHSVLACGLDVDGQEASPAAAYTASLRGLGVDARLSGPDGTPSLAYEDASWRRTDAGAAVPCHSIWSAQGRRLGCVALYRVTLRAEEEDEADEACRGTEEREDQPAACTR